MNQFYVYLKMGFEHISNWTGYDHMLFIIVLCAVYTISEWRKVALLVTAFTIGHSVTLALSALKIVVFNAYFIELLIPITIFCTAINNLFHIYLKRKTAVGYNYFLALIFGFIHGMAFSNYFNALMSDSLNIILPLFSFNIGLELGQLLIVFLFFSFYFIINKIKTIPHNVWNGVFSSIGAIWAVIMIINRI